MHTYMCMYAHMHLRNNSSQGGTYERVWREEGEKCKSLPLVTGELNARQ